MHGKEAGDKGGGEEEEKKEEEKLETRKKIAEESGIDLIAKPNEVGTNIVPMFYMNRITCCIHVLCGHGLIPATKQFSLCTKHGGCPNRLQVRHASKRSIIGGTKSMFLRSALHICVHVGSDSHLCCRWMP